LFYEHFFLIPAFAFDLVKKKNIVPRESFDDCLRLKKIKNRVPCVHTLMKRAEDAYAGQSVFLSHSLCVSRQGESSEVFEPFCYG